MTSATSALHATQRWFSGSTRRHGGRSLSAPRAAVRPCGSSHRGHRRGASQSAGPDCRSLQAVRCLRASASSRSPSPRARDRAQRPQRQRQADRAPAVVPARLDPQRHHREHRATPDAQVAPARDQERRRRRRARRLAAHLAITQPVPVQAKAAADRSARAGAGGTVARASLLDRPRSLQPGLEVERAVNDEGGVLARRQSRGGQGHDAVGVRAPTASPTFGGGTLSPWSRASSAPDGAGPTFWRMAVTAVTTTQRARSARCSHERARSPTARHRRSGSASRRGTDSRGGGRERVDDHGALPARRSALA